MKICWVLSFCLLTSSANGAAAQSANRPPSEPKKTQIETSSPPAARHAKVPDEITLTIEIIEASGIDNPRSFWEGVYEIRIADWSEVVEKTKAGSSLDAGQLLVRSSFSHRAFNPKDNRELRVTIPVKDDLLVRLREETKRAQAFLLRSKIRAYDAQVDRNYAFELNRVWQFRLFPDGKARITLALKPDGSYNTLGPLPAQLPQGYTVIGQPGTLKSQP